MPCPSRGLRAARMPKGSAVTSGGGGRVTVVARPRAIDVLDEGPGVDPDERVVCAHTYPVGNAIFLSDDADTVTSKVRNMYTDPKRLRDYLGVDEILWLGEGIEGDDTDGHIDDLARFIEPQTIVVGGKGPTCRTA